MNYWILVRVDFYFERGILCEDGDFHFTSNVMEDKSYIPVLFISRQSARQARKAFGSWPKYRIVKIDDPSWLN